MTLRGYLYPPKVPSTIDEIESTSYTAHRKIDQISEPKEPNKHLTNHFGFLNHNNSTISTEDSRFLSSRAIPYSERQVLRPHPLVTFISTLFAAGDDYDNYEHKNNINEHTCSEFTIIDLAIAYDSTYCGDKGDALSSEDSIRQIIADTSRIYQQDDLCVKLEISYLEGFCDPLADPYTNMVREFGSKGERLNDFSNYWVKKKSDVNRSAAMLFTGSGTVMDEFYIGNARKTSICDPKRAYAVVAVLEETGQPLPQLIVAHELGHILGAHDEGSAHYEGEGQYIMKASIGSGCKGFQEKSVSSMRAVIAEKNCFKTEVSIKPNESGPRDILGLSFVFLSLLFVGTLLRIRRIRNQ